MEGGGAAAADTTAAGWLPPVVVVACTAVVVGVRRLLLLRDTILHVETTSLGTDIRVLVSVVEMEVHTTTHTSGIHSTTSNSSKNMKGDHVVVPSTYFGGTCICRLEARGGVFLGGFNSFRQCVLIFKHNIIRIKKKTQRSAVDDVYTGVSSKPITSTITIQLSDSVFAVE